MPEPSGITASQIQAGTLAKRNAAIQIFVVNKVATRPTKEPEDYTGKAVIDARNGRLQQRLS